MSFSTASVVATAQLTRRIRRITLAIDDPTVLQVQPSGDSAVGVYFSGTAEPPGRNYSVRRQDGDRIELDIVLHAHGPGTDWARATRPGDRVGLDHARSWYRPPPTAGWQILATDLSGLPAAARIIEELPGGVPVTAVVEVLDRDEVDYLPLGGDEVTVVPCVGTGNGRTPSRLAAAVRALTLPDDSGYCWFAGEAVDSRAVRKYLRGRGWTIDQYDITGYWRVDSATWDARYAAVGENALLVYQQALAAGKGDKAAAEEFDEALERIGL